MNKFFALNTTILTLAMSILVTPFAYAQTTGATASVSGQIVESVTQAIPISSSILNSATWQKVSGTACKNVTSSVSNGSVTIPARHVLLNFALGPLGGNAASGALNLYDCTQDAYEQVAGIATNGVNLLLNLVLKYLLWTLASMVTLGIWLLRLAAYIMTLMLGQGSFITNGLVQEAWPFVQGLANLGFIFALLYIAFATTLRLQSVSTSVQRLLPKLLIGALLVNFSLVIGGLLIDTSRLVMAVEFNLIGGGGDSQVTINNIAKKLLDTSNVYGTVFQKNTGLFVNSKDGDANPISVSVAKSDSWSLLIEAIQSLIFVYAVAIGMIVIALGLFWRYIMLLLLLIASPMAYVAVALPQTAHWFDQWWKLFLKWVMYGPIMLFILILIVRVQAIPPIQNIEGDTRTPVYESIIRLIVTVTLMIVAAKISSGSSGVFANSFMGMVGKTGAWAKKNPKMALTLASGGAALPLVGAMGAAQYGASAARNNARDYFGAVQSNALSKARKGEFGNTVKSLLGPERDDKGKLKPGESSFGSRRADYDFLKIKDAQDAAAASSNVMKMAEVDRAAEYARRQAAPNMEDPLHSSKLLNKKVAMGLSKDQLKDIAKHGTKQQVKALISHKDVVRKMDAETKNDLYNAARTSAKEDWGDVSKQIDSRMRDLANEK